VLLVTKGLRDLKEHQEKTDLMATKEPLVCKEVKETMVQQGHLVFPDLREKMDVLPKLTDLQVLVVLLVLKVKPDMLANKDIPVKTNPVGPALLVTMVPQDPKELQVNLEHLVWLDLKENKVVVITAPLHVPHQVIKWLLLEGSFHFEWLPFPSVFVFIFLCNSFGKK